MLDLKAIYATVNIRRQQLGLTWDQTATQIGVSVGELKSMAESDANPPVAVPFDCVKWCGVDIEGFLLDDAGSAIDDERREKVASFLRANRELKPDDAAAIEEILQAAHERFTSI